ncbi:conserved hypothetical protein [Methylobacterium sp. 4-46]|uniref:DUF6496 domain-containing protein n=1 Tax=unclassified Methylobacterium TaxID=2615210 RepID=UPI000152DF95|nr:MULTISPECIES: DUF6496 domain-containing protein [Methylobacterium]ACA19809.1 conserved hypothetical protein [Methylobacterium sp. 4-46]WFT78994.1 DUF6496 domain-containing protein [Methylobacterium nodulans]
MARTTPAQKQTIERVMHAFKEGDLAQNGGRPVTDPKQAIAIALREAGASNQQSPEANRASFRRTRREERAARARASRAELYAEAKRRNIPGRSRMSRGELEQALDR